MAQKRTTAKAGSKAKTRGKAKTTEPMATVEISEGIILDLYDFGERISAKITLADAFVIFARVIDGKNGYFLSYPSYKGNDGEYHNQAYCFDTETIEAINNALEDFID